MRYLIIIISILFISSMAMDTHAQCYENRHSTNWFDTWTSCEASPNPNANRTNSHWIMYDLEYMHRLDRTYIWNYNDVHNLNYGIQEVAIDYSLDGSNWIHIGNYTIGMADGASTYQGESGPNLGGIEARYVLLTALSNYGGDCYGLGEIRIEAEEINVAINETIDESSCLQVDVFPNPIKDDAVVYIKSDCKGEITFQLIDMQGKTISKREITNELSRNGQFNLEAHELGAGEYILEIGNEEGAVRKTVIKL